MSKMGAIPKLALNSKKRIDPALITKSEVKVVMKRSKIFSGYCNSLQWFLMSGNNSKLRKNHINCRDVAYRQGRDIAYRRGKNKRRLSAEGYSLLPSALRPRLLGQKFIKNTQFWTILALFQIVAASTIFSYLCSTPVSAASLTLTIPSSFSLDIAPSSGGAFVKSEAKSFNVKTDNEYGYTLSVKAKNSDNSNVLLNGSNKLNSISEQTTEDNFKSDTKFNNTWGFLPSKFNSKNNTNFLPGPTAEESILDNTKESNSQDNDYSISLAVKLDNNIMPGTYSNTFVISAMTITPKIDGIMQNWTLDNCSSLTDGQIIYLQDTRDNNIYRVAKLKDNLCWMIDNLALGGKSEMQLTPSDTNISSNYILPASRDTFSVGWLESTDVPAYLYINQETKTGYYTWTAATAETGTDIASGENAEGSICPSGWRLPIGNYSDGHVGILASLYDMSSLKEIPIPNFNIGGGSAKNGWWTSTRAGKSYNNRDSSYTLYTGSSNLDKSQTVEQWAGYAIRCVIDDSETKKQLRYVGKWGKEVKNDEITEAIDARDGKHYSVARLADDRLWITQNMAWDIGNSYSRETPEPDDNKYGSYYDKKTGWKYVSGVCPIGWQIPSRDEYQSLISHYTFNTIQQSPANFTLPGYYTGGRSTTTKEVGIGTIGRYWTTTYMENNNNYLYILELNSDKSSMQMTKEGYMNYVATWSYYSIRCIAKDGY